MKRASINDVAEKASVSKTTVSHVINNTRNVEEETRRRVMQAIEELGYQPSLAARSLTTNRTDTIGIIVSDVTNQFFGAVLHGIEEISRPQNYNLVVCNTDEILEREDHYIDLLLRQRVDGIIAAATSQKWDVLNKADVQHTPLVFVDREYEGLSGPFVGVDNFNGARMGAHQLINCGHRKIGILAGFQRLSTMRDRLAGFKTELGSQQIPLPEEWIVESSLNVESGCDAAIKLLTLPERPTALFINNNFLALGTLIALKKLGMRCPEDIALIGFDDHPWAEVACPPMTVIRQPAHEVGKRAAAILLDLINHNQPKETRVKLNCELVIRSSC